MELARAIVWAALVLVFAGISIVGIRREPKLRWLFPAIGCFVVFAGWGGADLLNVMRLWSGKPADIGRYGYEQIPAAAIVMLKAGAWLGRG
jgi:hypothetical protein